MTDTHDPAAPPAPVLREYYHLHFAGRPRITRNVSLLGQLIALAERGQHDELAALWREEKARIDDEQARAGAHGQLLAQQLEQAEMVLQRAHRLELQAHLMHPAAIDVEALRAAKRDVAPMLETLAQTSPSAEQAATSTRRVAELEALPAALDACITRAEQARSLGDPLQRARAAVRAAQLLQQTFDTRVHGLPSTIIRPERLDQLGAGLAAAAQDLGRCPIAGAEHHANAAALAAQAEGWCALGRETLNLRRQLGPDELAHALGEAADQVLTDSEQALSDGSPAAIAQALALCDRIDEIVRQLQPIPLIYGLSAHQHTLSTVTDAWAYLSARLDRLTEEGAQGT